MANASSTGFGMKPVKMAGQSANTAGLGEYPVAASSSAIYNQDLVAAATSGFAAVAAAGTEQLLGSLNGVFYTDASTSKPTFQAYLLGSNTASDIVALVNDDPHQMYEIRSNNAGASAQTDVGNTADISYSAGATPNYISRSTLDDSSLSDSASKQVKIVGVSRDPDNSDLTSANVVWRVIISEHFFKQHVGV
tara:strand:+ start:131 stop:709 length:579 start_codon:yes stop_codon:yes gene_type:complete